MSEHRPHLALVNPDNGSTCERCHNLPGGEWWLAWYVITPWDHVACADEREATNFAATNEAYVVGSAWTWRGPIAPQPRTPDSVYTNAARRILSHSNPASLSVYEFSQDPELRLFVDIVREQAVGALLHETITPNTRYRTTEAADAAAAMRTAETTDAD